MVRTPFHLVEPRPWALVGSVAAMVLATGVVGWLHGYGMVVMLVGSFLVLATMVQWWRDVIRESTYQGNHTTKVVKGLRLGIVLFIIAEGCFFFPFF